MTKAKDELRDKIYTILHDDIELRTDNGQPYLYMTDTAEDNLIALIAAQNLALLTRLEAEPTIADLFPTHPENNPDSYDDMVSVVKWYKSKFQSERALIEKRMM